VLTQEDVTKMFHSSKALMEGHFLLSSGRHSDKYIQCARVLQHPSYADCLGQDLAERFSGLGIDVVIGPAMGGILVAYTVAGALGAQALFTEREEGTMTLRRGLSIEPGQRVLVVEDVVTTGGSTREVLEVVRGLGGQVSGVGALVDRSGGNVDFGVPFQALLRLDVASYAPGDCPICREGVPLVKPGSKKTPGPSMH